MELYRRHRPKMLKQVLGQPQATEAIRTFLEKDNVPHSILFTGPSGCGKTTLARILRNKLKCTGADFQELNCADFRGIDMVRDIRQRMGLAAMGGGSRIWLIDECHKMSNDAQNAFLKMLEEPPDHVYFMLATTDPAKLLPTIRTRCTEIRVQALPPKAMETLLQDVLAKEGASLSEEVIEKIVNVAEGSARKALVLLDQVRGLATEEEQLETIASNDAKQQGIMIARALFNPRCTWAEMAKVLKSVDEEPETLRYMVLAYATNVLLGGGKLAGLAAVVIDAFERNYYDSKRAGLVLSCWVALKNR